MVNLITRMVCMEVVWRQCGERYFLWRFYGKISLEVIWGVHGEKNDKSNYQTISIKWLLILINGASKK